jgi:hypothetical protein
LNALVLGPEEFSKFRSGFRNRLLEFVARIFNGRAVSGVSGRHTIFWTCLYINR